MAVSNCPWREIIVLVRLIPGWVQVGIEQLGVARETVAVALTVLPCDPGADAADLRQILIIEHEIID